MSGAEPVNSSVTPGTCRPASTAGLPGCGMNLARTWLRMNATFSAMLAFE